MKTKAHLLIVDDDERLRELLSQYLIDHGFLISTALDSEHARALLEIFTFDLIILDIMMPGENGFDLTKFIRCVPGKTQRTPILLLTAMSDVEQRIEGLAHGADDYLVKPFDPRELLLRIKAILKRATPLAPLTELRLGEAIYNLQRNVLLRNNEAVPLTTVESSLLRIFSKNAGQVLSREDLIAACEDELNLRTIDVQITRLRRKIEINPKVPHYLQTVRSKGYVLIPDE